MIYYIYYLHLFFARSRYHCDVPSRALIDNGTGHDDADADISRIYGATVGNNDDDAVDADADADAGTVDVANDAADDDGVPTMCRSTSRCEVSRRCTLNSSRWRSASTRRLKSSGAGQCGSSARRVSRTSWCMWEGGRAGRELRIYSQGKKCDQWHSNAVFDERDRYHMTQ